MKKIKYLVLGLVVAFTSCETYLDKEPLTNVGENLLWTDKAIVNAYVADVYNSVVFRKNGNTNFILFGGMAGEICAFSAGHAANAAPFAPMTSENLHRQLNYWEYETIRKANILINELPTKEFDDDYINKTVSELRWLRAYMYFEMVKRFGGVPLITEVQGLDDDYESLFVSRNTEQEVYDFIDSEMNAIYNILPESYEQEKGRVTKWAARALQSRAMLYAASIANFGTVELEGLVGISASPDVYYQKAYNASKDLIDNSGHILFRKFEDPAENYHQLFIEELETNPEVIFSERYDASSNAGHSFSLYTVHADFSSAWDSAFRPTYDIVEKFEFTDGSSGIIPRNTLNGEWDMDDLFANRDPRFKASFVYNGAEMAWNARSAYGTNIAYFHEKSKLGGANVTSGVLPDGTPAQAEERAYKSRPGSLRQGFLLRKFLDESSGKQLAAGQSSEDRHIFRLGEIYLNMAEAAFYLGSTGEALDLVNEIRDRAGMPDKLAITEDVIRNERAVELVFEEHRYWDLRRWRIAESELDGKRFKGLKYDHYNHDTKLFKISLGNAYRLPHTFKPEHYYFPFTDSKISDNPNLKENPNYN